MTHRIFLTNLNKIYRDITSYNEMIVNDRLDLLLNTVINEKDFRYLIPLYVMPDFMFVHFNNFAFHHHTHLINMLTNVYQRTKRIALLVKKSVDSRDPLANFHRTYPAKVSIAHFANKHEESDNIVTYKVSDYKLQSDFFYEHIPRFNHVGPLYEAVKRKLTIHGKVNMWSMLPIQDRKLSDYNCVIEYYIYQKSFPIEGKFIKDNDKKNLMFLTPSLDALRAALKAGNIKLISYNFSQYPLLSITMKRAYLGIIKENYHDFKQYTKKCDLPYLNAWRLGSYENKKENS